MLQEGADCLAFPAIQAPHPVQVLPACSQLRRPCMIYDHMETNEMQVPAMQGPHGGQGLPA